MTFEKFLLASIAAFAMAACAPKEAAEEAPAAEQPSAEPAVVEPSTEEPAAETPAIEEPAADACGAADHQSLIGSNVAAITLPVDLPHRIYKQGDPVTMDYRPDRLNIMTDENGVIIEVKCG